MPPRPTRSSTTAASSAGSSCRCDESGPPRRSLPPAKPPGESGRQALLGEGLAGDDEVARLVVHHAGLEAEGGPLVPAEEEPAADGELGRAAGVVGLPRIEIQPDRRQTHAAEDVGHHAPPAGMEVEHAVHEEGADGGVDLDGAAGAGRRHADVLPLDLEPVAEVKAAA